MRVAPWRPLAFGLLFLPVIGLSVAAQPPVGRPTAAPPTKALTVEEIEKLKADLAALAGDKKAALPEETPSSERAKLRAELAALLDQIKNLPSGSSPPRSQDPYPPPKVIKPIGPDDGPAPDKLSAATNYFRSNDFQAALGVLQQINLAQLGTEDRAFAKYLTGCCQRRLSNIPEALRLFREVSNPPVEDEFLSGCALWQISLIRANQDLATQLEQLRARQKSK